MMDLLVGAVIRSGTLWLANAPPESSQSFIIHVGKSIRQPLPRRWERKVRAPQSRMPA